MDTFFIIENGKSVGPFTIDELKQKKINKETLVWTESFKDWTKAEHVPILKDILTPIPPPPPSHSNDTSHTESKQQTKEPSIDPNDKYFGYQLASGWMRLLAIIIQSLILTIPLHLFFSNSLFEGKPFTLDKIIAWTVISAIVGMICYPLWSGNLGHKIMGLKVISALDGSDKKNYISGGLREAIKNIFGLVIIPAVWLLWDPDHQNLYDKVVKTYVVKKKVI